MMTTELEPIGAEMTVNEAIRRFPASLAVFRQYGIDSCCGGARSLGEAAARHGADPAVLVAAVRAAAASR